MRHYVTLVQDLYSIQINGFSETRRKLSSTIAMISQKVDLSWPTFGYNFPMAEQKTKATNQNPKDFLDKVEPEQKRLDSFALLELFQKVTGEKAVMW